jgi:hypothetical protein
VSESGFFDAYPRFYETGNTPAGARLNARYEALIERHLDFIAGKTILDIGSHDGRWGFAALQAGAKHVIGIEPRAELVENAIATFGGYGIQSGRFAFVVGDALAKLRDNAIRVDTVFLFGILYHVYYHIDLIAALAGTGTEAIIVDTQLAPDGPEGPYANAVSFWAEETQPISQGALEAYPGAGRALVGIPSRAAVRLFFRVFGFAITEVDWKSYLAKWVAAGPGLADYAAGERGTFLARRRDD